MDNKEEVKKCEECGHEICPMCHLGCHNIDCGSFVDPIRAGKANCFELLRPSHQSPVSDRTQAFGKNKGGSPIPYSDFQMIKVETRSENLSGMEIKLSPVSEEWEERFEKEIIDYFWDRETVIGTQRLSLNHINKIKDFIRKQRQEAYEEGLKERCQNMLSKEETYLKAQHELAEEIMDYMENGLDEPTDWYVSVKNFLLSRGLLPKITE